MAVVENLFQALISPWAIPAALSLLLASYLYDYLVRYRHLRSIPAPLGAQFSNLWLLSVCRRGIRYKVVDRHHSKLGKVIRIQPNHVSIADDSAIPLVYGHGNGFLKSEYYKSFIAIDTGLFNTRSRADHTRKRKMVSHAFSVQSVSQFEPHVHDCLALFVKQLDRLVETSVDRSLDGRREAHVDSLLWFNLLAFDVIGELAFGAPLGMLQRGADLTETRSSPDSVPSYVPAIETINRRGEVSATLGCCPALQPFAKWIPDPFFSRGLRAVGTLAGIAIARVKSRIENPPDVERQDLLARLLEGKDEKGQPMGRTELYSEALTHLIAGSDTTSNSSCALMNYLVRDARVMAKLREELDTAVPADVVVPAFETVRNLPYLGWVVDETLRHHSTSAIGLPRLIPPESSGATILGHHFPAGTVLSVPTYTMHHSKEIWGDDADDFRPERWEHVTARQKNAFIPFSHGPRACIGRNVAEMEMKLIAATWVRRYAVRLRQGEMQTREGFLRKPLGLEVGLSSR